MPVVWFNRPYLRSQVVEGDLYLVHGAVRRRGGHWELGNPTCESASTALHGGRIVPVYPSIGKMGSIGLRHLLDGVLDQLDLERVLPDRLPEPLQ